MLTLADVHQASRAKDARAVVADLGLGRGLLVGQVPEAAAQGWSYRTGETAPVLPPNKDGAGLFPETLVFPLVKTRKGTTLDTVVLVGRSPSNDVVLNHHQVSKLHARIALRGSGYVVMDAQSANGTSVNGVPAPSPKGIALGNGDQVLFGVVALTYYTTPALLALLRERTVLNGR